MRGMLDFLRADPRLAFYGLFVALGSSFGQTFFISQFGGEIRAEFGLSDGDFGTIYGLGTLLSAAVIVYTGGIVDRVDLRRWTFCLILACSFACLVMGFVVGPVTLFFAIFLLRHTGQGLMSHTMGHSLGRYSWVGRGKAIAFGSYGYPIGESLFPILAVTVIALFGWREAWYGLSIAYPLLVLPLALFLLRGHDARYERFARETSEDDDAVAPAEARRYPTAPLPPDPRAGPRPSRQWRRREVMRDPRFYLVLPAMMAPSFIVTGLFLHGVRIAELKGWSHELWAGSIVAYAVGSIPAGLAMGAFVDRFGAARGLGLALPPLMLSCLLLAINDHPWSAPITMGCMGITGGMMAVLSIALWVECYGTKYLGEIKALMTSILVFASAAAPPVLGWMFDWGWSVAEVALFCAAYAGVGCVLSLYAGRRYVSKS